MPRSGLMQLVTAGVSMAAGAALVAFLGAAPSQNGGAPSTGGSGAAPPAIQAPPNPTAPAPASSANELADAQARQILAKLVGFWRVSGQSFDEQGQPNSTLGGSATYGWALGGLFLAGEQVLSNGSEMLQWVDYVGFNQTSQHFSRTLLTDRDPVNYCAMGIWDQRARLLTFMTDSVRAPDGSERRIQSTLDLSREDQPSWELVYIVGGGATEKTVGTVRLTFTRATQDLAPSLVPGGSGGGLQGNPGAPGGLAPGPMSPAQVQQQLDSVLRTRQQMQQRIEDMRKQMQQMSETIGNITR